MTQITTHKMILARAETAAAAAAAADDLPCHIIKGMMTQQCGLA
jgi:hypothetical protein